jgi:general secretion pathway protein D
MESVMRVGNGDIAVLGGLMEDGINYRTDAVPVLGRLPVVGNFFTYRNDSNRKSELVIFLRPVVVKQASVDGDYRSLRDKLPDAGYFRQEVGTPRPVFDLGGNRAP